MKLADPFKLGRRIAPPIFVEFGVVLLVLTAVLAPTLGLARGVMVAFDVGALLFFWQSAALFRRAASDIRRSVADNDANRTLLLTLTATATLMILVAVYSELRSRESAIDIALAIATLACTWLVSNLVYTFHYAHIFYMDGDDGHAARGLTFPETETPAYWDFLYFSVTLGMTFQTSDVTINATRMRGVVIGQCLAAFVFNLGVLGFTINVLGGR